MDLNNQQFGSYASGTDYYPQHAKSQMGGSDTGRHARTTKSGKRVASRSDAGYIPQHSKSNMATNSGKHTAGGVMKAAHGAMKALHKAVTGR